MLRRHIVALGAALGLALALPAMAQWKWIDPNGRTQYSDLPPPPGTPERNILHQPAKAAARIVALPATPASAASAPPLAVRASDPELEARRKEAAQRAEQLAAAKKKADDARIAAARADNCNRAKAQLRAFDSGIRISRVNEKGEREFLDDATRAAEAKRTRDIVAADCS